MCVRVRACICVRACVRACVRVRVRVRVCACVRVCVSGNGLLVRGYARKTRIEHNEFYRCVRDSDRAQRVFCVGDSDRLEVSKSDSDSEREVEGRARGATCEMPPLYPL